MVEMIRPALLVALLFAPGMASAQARLDCPQLGGVSDAYKIVLDDLSLPADAGVAAAKLNKIKSQLAFTLSVQIQEFLSDVDSKQIKPGIGLDLINCENRKPSPGGAEFNPQRVRALNDNRVVVELWGNLLVPEADEPDAAHALIGYIIPPVMHYLPGGLTLGRFSVRYPKSGGDAAVALQKLPEASAFAMVGLGLKAYKAKKYDVATWAFGRSEAGITQAQAFGGSAELGALLKYVRHAACEVREKARDDTSYDGPLSLTPREQCGAMT
jgi:hypothetical protein